MVFREKGLSVQLRKCPQSAIYKTDPADNDFYPLFTIETCFEVTVKINYLLPPTNVANVFSDVCL